MAEIAESVAAKVAEYLVDPIIRRLGYLFNYRRNITDLNQQIHSLDLERERLQIPVNEAIRQGDEIFRGVQEWLTYAEGIIQKRDDFNEYEQKASKSCFYLKSRYQLSKQAKKQATEIVDKIQAAHNFGGRVSYRPPPPPPPPFISTASFKDYEVFDSRESTSNQIMEALRNEDMSMIGVWGMGGVGKTTLVKQVAQQAEKDKLFHMVVMALNISQTPNIAEIQEKIARVLGLKFEAGDDRVGRLRQRLKKEEKILVILDDIWEKLELGKIGIPFGDDHKGCKVLLTSRERQVLSKDMRTQKEFHLQHLSEEEAWNLFKKIAGDSEREKRELPPIAVDVAKECGGLPVAIVTIATALRGEKVPVWKNALEELKTGAPTSIRGVNEKVYACLELSYNYLKGNEVKSLFLLCALMGDGDISMDRLLQYAMGLNLFKGISWDNATNKLITLVENLKASSLLLDGDGYSSLFFDESMLLRMHDVVRDVARSIASKDPHQFVVKEAVGEQEEWQWMDECRNWTRISLKCTNIDELPQGLVCPKLEFFLLDSSNARRQLKIPDAFLQDTKQLRVLDLSRVFLTPSPSSLGFLSNLRTLCLNHCVLEDIAVIGDLKRLQVLSLAGSRIKQLPKEMMQLSDLRVLDLRNCKDLNVIPRNVISSLSRLEYLSMESFDGWEKEGFNSGERINNACVSELKHLSGLRSLEVGVRDTSLLPEDDVLFDNLNLTRYSIQIRDDGYYDPYDDDWLTNDVYNASRKLMLCDVKSLHMVKCSKLLKRSQVVELSGLNDTKHVVYELDKEGFVELKYLSIFNCHSIQYILHSSTSVEWTPPPNTFHILEKLYLVYLNNLEAVCHGPIPTRSFGNLRILEVTHCERLNYIISLPTEHGREPAFSQLQSLRLENLEEVISFYSTRSSSNEESVPFFNQQATFPSLEFLYVDHLDNLRALWHNQLPADSLSKLKELKISSCYKLLNIFPSNILKGLQSLQILTISWCRTIQYIIDSTSAEWVPPRNTFSGMGSTSAFPQLQKLELKGLNKVISFYSDESVTFFNQQATFPALETLNVHSLDNVRALWHNQLREDSFSKLKNLYVNCCNKLLNVFPLSVVKVLVQLEVLRIISCGVLEAIVANENEDEDESVFPQLQKLELRNLPEVISFYFTRSSGSEESVTLFNQQVAFPALKSLSLYNLDNVRSLWHNQLPEDSFSKLKNLCVDSCNKLLNVFPISVVKALVQLENLKIISCGVLEAIVANENEDEDESVFPQLQELELRNLPKVISFYFTRSSGSEESVTLFNQQAAFPALKSLSLYKLDNVRALWHYQLREDSFSKLKNLCVDSCNKLLNFFPLSVVKALVQLEDLKIISCGVLEAIVANENEDEDEATLSALFPKLTSLKLNNLPQLKRFCFGRFTSRWSLLKKLEVSNCDKVEIFFQEMGLEGELDNKIQQPLFVVEKVAFPSLEFLYVHHLDNLRALWHNQLPADSFSKLKELKISSCNKLLNIFSSNILKGLRSLQILKIHYCDALKDIFVLEGINGKEIDDIAATQSRNSLFTKNLRGLLIFQNLQSLEVNNCPCLKYVFPIFVAKALVQLEDLQIDSCGVEAIVANEDDDEDEAAPIFLFPRLISLKLKSLYQLQRFYLRRFTSRWPILKELEVCNCDKVEVLFQGISLEDELDNKIQQSLFFVKKEAFPNLEELRLTLKGIVEIWQGQFSRVSFSKLRVLNIKEWHGISIVISSNMVQMLHNLERLEVTRCNSVNEVIQVERLLGEEFHVDTFSRLTKIYLKDLPMLMHFYGLGLYFQSCQTLQIDSCGNLINLVTPSMAKRLVQLERLIIRKCHMVEKIVGNEGDEPTNNEIDFNRLVELELDCLPNLKSFCSARYTFQFPSLKRMQVTECPKMKFFCKGVLNTPKLKGVQMSDDFLEQCWEGDLNTTIQNKFMKFMEQFEDSTESEEESIEESEEESIEESE